MTIWSIDDTNLLHSMLKSPGCPEAMDKFVEMFNAAARNRKSSSEITGFIRASILAGSIADGEAERALTIINKSNTFDPRAWATADEAAVLCKYSPSNIRLLAKRGHVRRMKHPRLDYFVYSVDDLAKYISPTEKLKRQKAQSLRAAEFIKKAHEAVRAKTPGMAPLRRATVAMPPTTPAPSSFEDEVLTLVETGQLSKEGAVRLLGGKRT